jgi:hypothetical protein
MTRDVCTTTRVAERETRKFLETKLPEVARFSEEIKDADWPRGKGPRALLGVEADGQEMCPEEMV